MLLTSEELAVRVVGRAGRSKGLSCRSFSRRTQDFCSYPSKGCLPCCTNTKGITVVTQFLLSRLGPTFQLPDSSFDAYRWRAGGVPRYAGWST